MCGRYYVDEESNQELLRIIRNLDKRLQVKAGEIYPTNRVPVYTKSNRIIEPAAMTWGYRGFKGSNVIINARSETAREKKLFADGLNNRRIAIPANGFFEWIHTKNKQKYYFTSRDSNDLYMAGFYQDFEGDDRFVILTTSANSSMLDIHNRMPVLLEKNEMEPWIYSNSDAMSILKRIPKELKKEMITQKPADEFEQLTLPWPE